MAMVLSGLISMNSYSNGTGFHGTYFSQRWFPWCWLSGIPVLMVMVPWDYSSTVVAMVPLVSGKFPCWKPWTINSFLSALNLLLRILHWNWVPISPASWQLRSAGFCFSHHALIYLSTVFRIAGDVGRGGRWRIR